jgi:hypothetical protein
MANDLSAGSISRVPACMILMGMCVDDILIGRRPGLTFATTSPADFARIASTRITPSSVRYNLLCYCLAQDYIQIICNLSFDGAVAPSAFWYKQTFRRRLEQHRDVESPKPLFHESPLLKTYFNANCRFSIQRIPDLAKAWLRATGMHPNLTRPASRSAGPKPFVTLNASNRN